MNYLSHAVRFLDDPYFVGGVATPDWLRILGRHRATSKATQQFLDLYERQLSAQAVSFCHGVLQHHRDDDIFHGNPIFLHLNVELAKSLREEYIGFVDSIDDEPSMKVNFIAHLVIELLLDANLIEQDPNIPRVYYRQIDRLNTELIQEQLSRIMRRPVTDLNRLIRRFSAERFLYDYLDDRKLLIRVNQVLHRIGLAKLSPNALPWLKRSRDVVYASSHQLLDLSSSSNR